MRKINILIKTSENNKPNDLQINVNKFERTLRANKPKFVAKTPFPNAIGSGK